MEKPDALILFAHGARDARWRIPFDKLAGLVGAQRPDLPLRLAFLEFMQPDLRGAVQELAQAGCQRICLTPVFLAQGGHLLRDLPPMLRELEQEFGVEIATRAAIGEDDDVLRAIAGYCARV
ncbi:CbiX/SirB N-terminal domain-containing protein [Massilia sp. W12]|uniref:sirohydrochlorin chelatase n=1 Tax=Massilia sp. W12 TaxID=3126507 RepID=UPI0030CE7977